MPVGSVCLFARRAPCWACLTRCAFRIRYPKALAWSIATFVRACARLVGSDSRELGCRYGAGVRNVSLYAGILLFPRSFRLFKNLALRLFPRGCAGRMASCRCAVDKKRTFAVLSSALSQESHSSPGLFSGRDSLCFRRRVKSCRKSPYFVQVPDWPGVGKGQRGVASERADGLGRVGPRFALGLESAAGLGCTGPKCTAGLGGLCGSEVRRRLSDAILVEDVISSTVRRRVCVWVAGFSCGLDGASPASV